MKTLLILLALCSVAGAAVPPAPSTMTATPESASLIKLAWKDNSANETSFQIYRSNDGVTFSFAATAGINQTSYTSSGLKAATKYYYRVRAINGNGASAFSNIASAVTLAAPTPTPTPKPTPTPTVSPSATATITPRPTVTPSPTATATPSASPSATPTATAIPTPTPTPSPTGTPSPTTSPSPTPSPSPSPTATPTPTPLPTATPTPTASATPTSTTTPSPSPSVSVTFVQPQTNGTDIYTLYGVPLDGGTAGTWTVTLRPGQTVHVSATARNATGESLPGPVLDYTTTAALKQTVILP